MMHFCCIDTLLYDIVYDCKLILINNVLFTIFLSNMNFITLNYATLLHVTFKSLKKGFNAQ